MLAKLRSLLGGSRPTQLAARGSDEVERPRQVGRQGIPPRALAQRHVHYGVKEEHYGTVGQALTETLAAGLGTAFTPDVRAAWQAAYALLAGIMIDAAGSEPIAA